MEGIVEHNANGNLEAARGEVLVSVKHVSKKFCRHLRRSMAYGLLELSRNLVGLKGQSDTLRRGEFWALDDVSFELRRGETLGVLGLNGSGKTTLLRLLAGILPPDQGEIMVKGRLGTLISMGAGFHPYMTGRENIYINGSILGMTREEIDANFDNIIDFAEIGDFLDTPVSAYSSGMRVRLGFSIATAVIPDILLLDEVFAVGDVVFRQRCIERMRHIVDNSVVILVSNRPEFIEMLCNRALWLDKGKVVADGDVEEVGALYAEETSRRNALFAMRSGTSREGNGDLQFIDAIQVYGSQSGLNEIAIRGEHLIVEAPFACNKPWSQVRFCIELFDLVTGMPLTTADCVVPEVNADGLLRCTFYALPLLPRAYAITLRIMHADTVLDIWRNAALVTAQRITSKPSTKVKKYPHDLTVDTGDASYAYSYEPPKEDEPTVRVT